ncbi:MAG: hypothetical protein CMJ78_06770 [Planctomycetaceae bacterium]|nr:hypothetical protein [Planctomycetaceae bacterium]
MQDQATVSSNLATDIINQIETLLNDAESKTLPLELDPYRGQLFELFVTAEAADLVDDDSDPDLSADGIGRTLSTRWDLARATQDSVDNQANLPNEALSKMRMLWSFMRMWMEWTYAWQRWHEFHRN